jgi:hypothetical protein
MTFEHENEYEHEHEKLEEARALARRIDTAQRAS